MKISLRFYYASVALRVHGDEQGQNLRSEVTIMKFPIRFYFALGVSVALLAFLPRFVSLWPKFRNVAETPSTEWNGSIRYL